jgi:predicted RND superfamily exporter protein
MLVRLTTALARHPWRLASATVGVLLLLSAALLALPATGTASQEPGGPAFDARDLLAERLVPEVGVEFVLLEADDGDILDPDDLRTVHGRLERLRTEPATAGLLATTYDRVLERPVEGTLALTDILDDQLGAVGGLAEADDATVVAATSALLDNLPPDALGLSEDAALRDGRWSSAGLALALSLDTEALGGGLGGAQLGSDDTTREERLREVRDVLRGGAPGDGTTREDAGPVLAHAVAIDVNLTSAEQGEAAGPFIAVTVLLTLLLVGAVFRSAWTVAVVATGVAGLMLWLQGVASVLRLEQDQILATIVPIALIAFGIDFAFHALGRVEEERQAGRPPRGALAVGLAGVGGALLLALTSDSAAFLANTVSGIPSIVQFGVAASIGLVGAFLLLGVVAPTVVAALAERGLERPMTRAAAVRHLGAGVAAAGVATTSVLLTVYVAPPLGVGLFVTLVLALCGAALWAGRRHASRGSTGAGGVPADLDHHDTEVVGVTEVVDGSEPVGAAAAAIGRLVAGVARRGRIVLPAAIVVTAVAFVGVTRLEARFDVQDFFAADTDFVVALDALDELLGDSAGEATQLVVTADLGDPAVLAVLAAEVDALRDLGGDVLATDAAGRTLVDGGVVDLVRAVTTDPALAAAMGDATGVVPSDRSGDGIPDDRVALEAVLASLADDGLGADATQVLVPAGVVAGVFDPGVDGAADATVVTLQLPDSRELDTIAAADELLTPRVDALRTELRSIDGDATAELTGAPIVRQRSLDAVTRALLLSLPIAILACLLVAALALRSLRTAAVAVVPILLVVPWLYGVMGATGTAVNLVTGTIGAISIGIGIDFAIHLVARYREELARVGDRDRAMRITGEGTGVALVASAASSVFGFLVLAMAPMPMFAAFGLLTATMIAMALVATLLVLPPLLRLTSRDAEPRAEIDDARATVASA